MSAFQVYIAKSLDGYIAKHDGSVDWLENLPNPNGIDHGYTSFYDQIDVVLMGRKTYEAILGFDVPWPYDDCRCYVISGQSDYIAKSPNTEVVQVLNDESIQKIRSASKRNIWIIGGGQLIQTFLKMDVIDELIISIAPTLLGDGIPLFPVSHIEKSLKLISAEAFETGIVNLKYSVNP